MEQSDLRKLYTDVELERIAQKHHSKFLKYFSSAPAVWEFLLIVYRLDGNPNYGISDYISQLQTSRKTRLTMAQFVKDRIADGHLIVCPSAKKSRKTLTLSDELRKELEDHLTWIAQSNPSLGQDSVSRKT